MKTRLKSIVKILLPVFILSFSKLYSQQKNGSNSIHLSVYPNPSYSSFVIKYNLSYTIDKITLHIYNVNGKLVYQEDFYNCRNQKCEIVINSDLLNLSSGCYFLHLFYDNKYSAAIRIVIIK
ncbi:MAG: T9SS type A sorting domain-containing protein [Candidatus Aenigmatarchaeota archaeon]